MSQYILKLNENRVRRNYRGGYGLDVFKGKEACADGETPEDWICSTVTAKNPGLAPRENEGLSQVLVDGELITVKELFEREKEFYLGSAAEMPFLCKLLDSQMRLHTQAHPTKEFSRAFLNSNHGKLECYYILDVRDDVEPYIRLGFQHSPARMEWKRIIETQDLKAMDDCFERIPVQPGQIWYIPGGVPHAIGEGITMIEIMEPSDWVVRCEFEREGLVVPPEARFMGRDLEFCLDVFDYTEYTPQEVQDKFKLTPKPRGQVENLVDTDITRDFRVDRLKVQGETTLATENRLMVGIVVTSEAEICAGGSWFKVSKGESFVVAAKATEIHFRGDHAEIILIS
ncbi:hypothetical protein JJQ72_14715 [Paenibacillus sp. F411]|uniref:class I mannose-6-phosphate isomerase n=1 Tax=Paenibacillus sp. F411 TaxID=2820239 RepID=UPI001AAF60ED|nr:hypothetical protein [Paenibacillus sp. F411]MBO2945228.1 hypothetical protein [Paenibacillus sp. F411]